MGSEYADRTNAFALFRLRDQRVKLRVEVAQNGLPFGAAFGDFVKLGLHLGGERVVHDPTKVGDEVVGDEVADVCGHETALVRTEFFFALRPVPLASAGPFCKGHVANLALAHALGDVAALLDGRNGWSIG